MDFVNYCIACMMYEQAKIDGLKAYKKMLSAYKYPQKYTDEDMDNLLVDVIATNKVCIEMAEQVNQIAAENSLRNSK